MNAYGRSGVIHASDGTPLPPPGALSALHGNDQKDVQRRRVLVVDDERLIADTVAQILNIHGYDAFVAYDGHEALKLAEGYRPDFLLSDVMMPVMNGIDLAVAVERMLPSIKVLLFSGQAGTNALLQRTNVDFTLEAKPIHPEKLLRVLERLGSRDS